MRREKVARFRSAPGVLRSDSRVLVRPPKRHPAVATTVDPLALDLDSMKVTRNRCGLSIERDTAHRSIEVVILTGRQGRNPVPAVVVRRSSAVASVEWKYDGRRDGDGDGENSQ